MPRAASHSPARPASAPLSGRNRWSTVSAQATPPRARAHLSARIARARLSGPPEVATATNGCRSKPPIAASAAASSAAGEAALFVGRGLADRGAGIGKGVIELGKGDAGILFLVGMAQRHSELQKLVGRLGSLRVVLIPLGERTGRLGVLLARVEGLADPVLRAGDQRVFGVGVDEPAECSLCIGVIGLLHETEGAIVLLGRGTALRNGSVGRRTLGAGTGKSRMRRRLSRALARRRQRTENRRR